MTFNGALFDMHPRYQHFKALMMDFFRQEAAEKMELDGLQYVMSLSVGEQQQQQLQSNDNPGSTPGTSQGDLPPIHFRVYLIKSKKVPGSKVPRIELDEMGPRMDFKLGRWKEASDEVMSLALKKPKETHVVRILNFSRLIAVANVFPSG